MMGSLNKVLYITAIFIVYFILGTVVSSYAKVAYVLFSDQINTISKIINGLLNF